MCIFFRGFPCISLSNLLFNNSVEPYPIIHKYTFVSLCQFCMYIVHFSSSTLLAHHILCLLTTAYLTNGCASGSPIFCSFANQFNCHAPRHPPATQHSCHLSYYTLSVLFLTLHVILLQPSIRVTFLATFYLFYSVPRKIISDLFLNKSIWVPLLSKSALLFCLC